MHIRGYYVTLCLKTLIQVMLVPINQHYVTAPSKEEDSRILSYRVTNVFQLNKDEAALGIGFRNADSTSFRLPSLSAFFFAKSLWKFI